MRVLLLEAGKPKLRQHLERLGAGLRARHALDLEREDGVVHYIAPGQEQVPLRHEGDATEQVGGMAAVAFEAQDAAGVRLLQTCDDIKERALAAAAGADDGDEFAGGDARLKARQRRHLAVGLGQRAQFEQRWLRRGLRRSGDGHVFRLDRSLHGGPFV